MTLVWHRWNGLAALTLIVWRVLWGVAGSSTARFTSFMCAPSAALSYARALIGGRLPRYLGHNPLGAYMVLALLAAIAVQGSLGLFAVDDNDLTGGPLYRLVSEATNKWATRWHAWSFNYVIVTLVAIHVTANALYGLVKKEPLIRAMITRREARRSLRGRRRGHDRRAASRARFSLSRHCSSHRRRDDPGSRREHDSAAPMSSMGRRTSYAI